MKSLEVSEEKANQRVEEFKRQLKSLTVKLKEAENRAELAEKTVKKLQKEVDRLEGTFFGSDPNLQDFLSSIIDMRKEENFQIFQKTKRKCPFNVEKQSRSSDDEIAQNFRFNLLFYL